MKEAKIVNDHFPRIVETLNQLKSYEEVILDKNNICGENPQKYAAKVWACGDCDWRDEESCRSFYLWANGFEKLMGSGLTNIPVEQVFQAKMKFSYQKHKHFVNNQRLYVRGHGGLSCGRRIGYVEGRLDGTKVGMKKQELDVASTRSKIIVLDIFVLNERDVRSWITQMGIVGSKKRNRSMYKTWRQTCDKFLKERRTF